MLNVKRAIACLRQLRIGRTIECGWIADGSSDPTKCAIGVCIDVQASRTGIVLRIAGLNVKTRQPVMIDRLIRRINWRLPASIVRLILGSAVLWPIGGTVVLREVDNAINVARGETIAEFYRNWRNPTFSTVPM